NLAPSPNLGSLDPFEAGDPSEGTMDSPSNPLELPRVNANTVSIQVQPENEAPVITRPQLTLSHAGSPLPTIRDLLEDPELNIPQWIVNNLDTDRIILGLSYADSDIEVSGPAAEDRSIRALRILAPDGFTDLGGSERVFVPGDEDDEREIDGRNPYFDVRSGTFNYDPVRRITSTEASASFRPGEHLEQGINRLVIRALDEDYIDPTQPNDGESLAFSQPFIYDTEGPTVELNNAVDATRVINLNTGAVDLQPIEDVSATLAVKHAALIGTYQEDAGVSAVEIVYFASPADAAESLEESNPDNVASHGTVVDLEQERRDGSAFASVAESAATSEPGGIFAFQLSLTDGRPAGVQRFRLRMKDLADNWGPWSGVLVSNVIPAELDLEATVAGDDSNLTLKVVVRGVSDNPQDDEPQLT
ncbi:MAG: hypothetical protein AAGL98_11545, partial [Planctomycetota bacterium]